MALAALHGMQKLGERDHFLFKPLVMVAALVPIIGMVLTAGYIFGTLFLALRLFLK